MTNLSETWVLFPNIWSYWPHYQISWNIFFYPCIYKCFAVPGHGPTLHLWWSFCISELDSVCQVKPCRNFFLLSYFSLHSRLDFSIFERFLLLPKTSLIKKTRPFISGEKGSCSKCSCLTRSQARCFDFPMEFPLKNGALIGRGKPGKSSQDISPRLETISIVKTRLSKQGRKYKLSKVTNQPGNSLPLGLREKELKTVCKKSQYEHHARSANGDLASKPNLKLKNIGERRDC